MCALPNEWIVKDLETNHGIYGLALLALSRMKEKGRYDSRSMYWKHRRLPNCRSALVLTDELNSALKS